MANDASYWETTSSPQRLTRRRLVIAGGAAAAAFAASCGSRSGQGGAASPAAGGQPSAGTPQPGGTLTVTQTTNPPTLDAQRTTSFYGLLQSSAVYSRLLQWKSGPTSDVIENHDVAPELATSFESSDAVTWTVKLRPDAKYQNIPPVNGHAVEAEDIRATFTRAIDPATIDPNRSVFNMIDPAQ